VLTESVPDEAEDRAQALDQVGEIMAILRQRRETYRRRRPGVLNLISGAKIDRFLRNGLVGRLDFPGAVLDERRARARAEAGHLARLMQDEPIGVQIGIVPGTLPHTSFQIFRQPDRRVLAISPFRLGEQPNVHSGIAMITSAPEALALHEKSVEDMWRRALKGPAAAAFMAQLMAEHGG